MKISLRSEYALLLLIHIARQTNAPVTSATIAVSLQIPSEMLHGILVTLVNAKYLRLIKGVFRLAKPAEKIPTINIIRLFDGALAPLEPVSEKGYQPAPMENEEKLYGLFSTIQEQIVDKLKKTSLADLI